MAIAREEKEEAKTLGDLAKTPDRETDDDCPIDVLVKARDVSEKPEEDVKTERNENPLWMPQVGVIIID